MSGWLKVECGFDAANETINFGTRTLAEGDALYETTTLAVIGTDSQASSKPIVQCLNKNSKIYIAIDKTFRIFSNNCQNMDIFSTFEYLIDIFCVSEDGNLVVLCLNDGTIHCLYARNGGKLICSDLVTENSTGKCFLSAFSCMEDCEKPTFIISTKRNAFRLEIYDISKLYEDIENKIEETIIKYDFKKLENFEIDSGIIKIEYNNSVNITSNVYKRCYNNDDPFILALNNEKHIIGICKMTKIAFNLHDEESCEDLILLKGSEILDNRVVVLVSPEDSNSFVRVLSYPYFEAIYNIKVSDITYLVASDSEQDEVMFIEGACVAGSLNVNELRLKVIVESNPDVKLQRLLKRKYFQEAKEFAIKHDLCLQSIYQAEAEEFTIKSDFHETLLQPFCKILDNIDDINFIVNCCMNTSPNTLEGIEYLLDYAIRRLHVLIENNPEDEEFLTFRSVVLRMSYKLETFKILHTNLNTLQLPEIIEKWNHFSYIDFFDEICNYLKNGQIDKCTIMFNRLQHEQELDVSHIENMINTMPAQTPLLELIPLLRHMIFFCNHSLPGAFPFIIKWIYNTILNFNILKSNRLEYIFKFSEYIHSFIFTQESQCLNFHRYNLVDGCITKFRKLMNSLTEIVTIRNEYSIKITILDYVQDPLIIANLLLDKVMMSHLNNFINNFFLKFCCNNNLNVDDVLADYIQKLAGERRGYWEESATELVSYINLNSIRMDIILLILEAVDVPWSKFINDFVDKISKEYPSLAEKIKLKRENIPWKILLKKYDIPQTGHYEDNEVQLIIRRILLISKPDVLDDLNTVMKRYGHLKDSCSILCFNHYVQTGNFDAVLSYMKKLSTQILTRCFKCILFQVRKFLFMKHPFYNMLNNHFDILFAVIHFLKSAVPENEFTYYNNEAIKLKNIYLVKKYFSWEVITDEHFELSTLLETFINNIIVSVPNNQNWSEAVDKCETISRLIGVKKEKVFAELLNRNQSLELLIHVASYMIKSESNPLDMCEIAIKLMRNIENGYIFDMSSSTSSLMQGKCLMTKQHEKDSQTAEAFKLIYNLALNACIHANPNDLLVPSSILNWISACYALKLDREESPWTIIPVYKSEYIVAPSTRTISILKDFFDMFLTIAGTRLPLLNRINLCEVTEDFIVRCIQDLRVKITQLHVEGYDKISYHLLIILKNELLCSNLDANFANGVTNEINAIINSTCISQLLYKVFVQKDIDQQFALSLFLQPEFEPMDWTIIAIKKYKSNVRKLSAVSNLACSYMEMKGESKTNTYNAYFNLKKRCCWSQKFLHEIVSYNDTFQLNPDKIITQYLFKSNKFTLEILQQFCTDFNLNVQTFLPLYLRYTLLHWKLDIELIKDQNLEFQETMKENGPFSKCKDIICLLDNEKDAIDQLNEVWNKISYYQYEVYLCILDLLEILDQECLNPESRILLIHLKSYQRINKPQQKELDDWQAKYPFSREIDPLSDYRLPYLLEMFTKDLWEIIRPEINLLTYDRWFETASILKLDGDDICTYAIKGTIYSGVFNSNDRNWSVSSKNDSLLKNLEKCVSKITNLEVSTAALYQATCKVSGGADQVIIAKMCLKYVKHWKNSVSKTANMNDVLIKVKRKYLNCVSMHILYTHNLGIQKYLSLIENTDLLIRSLYLDDSIITRTKGTIMYYPDINSAVDEFGKQLRTDVNAIRTSVIMELLQESDKTMNFQDTNVNLDTISDNLKRIIYICESNATDGWTNLLYNISFSKVDETISEFVTSTDLSMQIKALQCLLVISTNIQELEEFIGEPASTYVAKLQILLTLESIGYSLTVYELESCNMNDLLNKILKSNSSNPLVIKSLSKLMSLYKIWDSNVWNIVLKSFIKLNMLSELQEWLPKLYKICYMPGVQCNYSSGWECLITNTFRKSINDHSNFVPALLLMQICPIIYKLDSCLLNIFNRYFENNIFEICAIFIPYLNNDNKKKCLQALKPHRTNMLFDKIINLSFQGILNTECAIENLKQFEEDIIT